MNKFLVCIDHLGDNPFNVVNQVKTLFEEALKKNNNENDIEEFMEERLPNILNTGFVVIIKKEDKSFDLNIFVENRDLIMISANYLDLSSLQNISTYNIALILRHKKDVEYLPIPKTVKEDIEPLWNLMNQAPWDAEYKI